MSRYNVFYLRAKGTEENCNKFVLVLDQYDGHTDDPYVAAKGCSGDDYVVEIRGALRGGVYKYMIDLPSDEESLAGLSKILGLAIEVFASDPGDGEFEYYYYVNGELVDSFDLPEYVPDEYMFEEFDISDDDKQKYKQIDNGGYVLCTEYFPDAKWDEYEEEMICNFKIEMDEKQEKGGGLPSDKIGILAMMGIAPDENGFAISFYPDENMTTLYDYFGAERRVIVPDGVTDMEMSCFSNNDLIEEVVLPASFKAFADECFNNCPNLKKVVIPSGTEVFGEDTFNGSENVVIYAPSGSGAEEFAKEKGISFQEFDSLDK